MKDFSLLLSVWLGALIPVGAEETGSRTVLFVDDHDVLYRSGTRKEVQPLRKHAANPVIAPDKPWEGMIGWVSTWRDPRTGKCQMWYQAYNEKRTGDKRLKCVVAYAESADGVVWTKPDLDLFPYYEVEKTNIVLIGAPDAHGDRYCNSVMVDPRDADPARRYKMVYYDWEPGDRGAGMHIAFSPDGIRWTKHPGIKSKTSFGSKGLQPPFSDERPYLETPGKNNVPRKNWRVPISMSDAQDVFYDELNKRYVSYGKMWMPGPDGGLAWKHGMGRIESEDFITWSRPQFILGPDDRDPPHLEFHTSPVFPYNGQYFSLNQILNRAAGVMDIELMSSRDGFAWERSYRDVFFLPRGSGAVFDASTLVTNNTPLLEGDEMRFYYGAYRGTAIGGAGLDRQVIGEKDYHSGVGLAVMRRDRFVAVTPDPAVRRPKNAPGPNTIGQITLRALDFSQVGRLTVNVDPGSGGKVWTEILTEDGYRVHGFSKNEAEPITTDSLAAEARWREKTLADLPGGRYLVRLHLEGAGAKIFACTLEKRPQSK